MSIHVEFVNTPLDYNLLLVHNCFYAIQEVASSVFWVVQFPFEGNISTIDQLDFYSPDISSNSTNNVALLAFSTSQYQYIGVHILKYSFLMGLFPLNSHPFNSLAMSVNMISSSSYGNLYKGKSSVDSTSLSHFEETYQAIQSTSDPTINDNFLVESNPYHLPYWLDSLPPSLTYLFHTLPFDESIMEVMYLDEIPWKYHHH